MVGGGPHEKSFVVQNDQHLYGNTVASTDLLQRGCEELKTQVLPSFAAARASLHPTGGLPLIAMNAEIYCNTTTSTVGNHPKTVGAQRNQLLPKNRSEGWFGSATNVTIFSHAGFEIFKTSKRVATQQISGTRELAKSVVFNGGPHDMSSPQTYRLMKSRPSSVTSYV